MTYKWSSTTKSQCRCMRIIYRKSYNERGIQLHNNLSMLTLPEKALLFKLYYQHGESATAAFSMFQ